jgi:1,4-dihydroxy-2-naphthoate octaprenyltransferase
VSDGPPPGPLSAWWLAVRPKTLSIAVAPVLVGSAYAWFSAGRIDLIVVGVCIAAAVLIQVGTNLHNDAVDFVRGADRSATRVGPPRVSAEGWLSVDAVRRAALLAFAAALASGGYLVWVGGWPILLLGLLSLMAGLGYSAGPWPISHSPAGEFVVCLFFGVAAVAGTSFLLTGMVESHAVLLGVAIGLPAAAVLAVNNLRDADSDRAAGRRTLAILLGPHWSRVEYALLMIGPFFVLPFVLGVGRAFFPALLSLPMALVLVRRIRTAEPGPDLNRLLADTARFQLMLAVLISGGLIL